jgi:hypothetical protein
MSTLNVDKVDPSTGTALELGTSGDTITVPSGATFVVAGTTEITGTNNVQRPTAQSIVSNGNMAVAQRGTSATGKTAGGYYAVDRMHLNVSSLGTWTIAQETLTSGDAYANGFQKAFRLDCTTADASPSAADHGYFRQKFEGQDVQVFKKGTANAEKYTLAFWVKSNKTGTDIFTCGLYDHDSSRSVFQNYTISSADTWEYKVLNFPADTTGVMDDDNVVSLDVRWYLGAGSNYTGGTQATSAWEAQTSANNLPSGKVNLADSTSNDIAITAVQLVVGEYTSTTLPPFQFENYGANLQRCQRYFNRVTSGQTSQRLVIGENVNTSSNAPIFQHHPPLRTAPSITVDNVGQFLIYSSASTYAATNIVTDVMNTKSSSLVVTVTGTMGAGNAGQFVAHATAKLDFSAEL